MQGAFLIQQSLTQEWNLIYFTLSNATQLIFIRQKGWYTHNKYRFSQV